MYWAVAKAAAARTNDVEDSIEPHRTLRKPEDSAFFAEVCHEIRKAERSAFGFFARNDDDIQPTAAARWAVASAMPLDPVIKRVLVFNGHPTFGTHRLVTSFQNTV